MVEKKLVSISPVLAQTYLRKLALWGSSYFGNDIYFLKEFVDICINEIGKERLVEMLKNDDSENKERNKWIGENWDKVNLRLLKFDKLLSSAKPLYDKIENKKFSKVDKSDVKEFIRASKKIPLIKQDIYTLAVFLIKNSTLQRMTIPSEAWRLIERSYKTIGVPIRRPLISSNSPEVEVTHD